MTPDSVEHQLFENRLHLDWLPDETVFSLASRYHFLSCNHKPAKTCQQLFGHPRSGSGQDFPIRTNQLSTRFEGTLGSGLQIISQHSLVPYFFPFHPSSRCLRWLELLAAGAAASVKAELGLLASQYGANFHLKACPECINDDVQRHHVAYWHIAHQLPGAMVCLHHRRSLQLVTTKVTGVDRFAWLLPSQVSDWKTPLAANTPTELACAGAQIALALWRLPVDFCFNQVQLRRIYNLRCRELDLISARNRFDQPRFNALLKDVLEATGFSTQFDWLNAAANRESFARRLIRFIGTTQTPRDSRHPLNHVLLWLTLFGSWESFQAAYQRHACTSGGAAERFEIAASPPAMHDPRKEIFLKLRDDGASVSAAARSAGVTVATGQTWAAAIGSSNDRRPKKLLPPSRQAMIRRLSRGADKAAVAAEFGVSAVTVTRILFTEPGLHDQWESARRTQHQTAARLSWNKVVSRFPDLSSADWRRLQPAAYAWLYRNDRQWLQDSIRNRSQPVKFATLRRNWKARDAALSLAVRVQALNWHQSKPAKRLTLGHLCSLIPGLKPKMGDLDKLPLTRMAIQETVGRPRQTAQSKQLEIPSD